MANLNVAVLGAPGYSKNLGKKGTESDLTFYNQKKGEDTVTFIEPSRYPERLTPLFYAISMAKKAILVIDEINPTFGETVIMLDCAGLREGFAVLRNYISEDQIAPLIKGTVVEGYEFVEDDTNSLRERLLEEAARERPDQESQTGTMPVDHFFKVRGVGTVVLGSVAEGTVKKHADMRVLPGEKTAQVRSIQKHDQDYDWAGAGERTGIALKGLDIEDLDRGTILTNDPAIKALSTMTARAKIVKYWPSPIKERMVIHLDHWMQSVPARVKRAEDGGDWHEPLLTLELDKVLVYRPGAKAVITYPEGAKLRVVGSIELPEPER